MNTNTKHEVAAVAMSAQDIDDMLNDTDQELITPPGGMAAVKGEVRYVREGSSLFMTNNRETVLLERIPAGTYTLMVTGKGQFYLEPCDNLPVPERLYGETRKHCEHFLGAFATRNENTGVLLSGEKGSGKSLLGCVMSAELLKDDIPTILVNNPYAGDGFNAFISSITQPCMVYFDEFEKVYEKAKGHEQHLLTLLAGVYQGKKLFVFTSNRESEIDRHMLNRPGRILYHARFRGVDMATVTEYAVENLANQDHLVGLQLVSAQVGGFNFDMLKNLVEEVNRFDKSPREAIKLMNIQPEHAEWISYDGVLLRKGEPVRDAYVTASNPMASGCLARFKTEKKDKDEDYIWESLHFERDHITAFDLAKGTITFVKDKFTVQMTRRYSAPSGYDYY